MAPEEEGPVGEEAGMLSKNCLLNAFLFHLLALEVQRSVSIRKAWMKGAEWISVHVARGRDTFHFVLDVSQRLSSDLFLSWMISTVALHYWEENEFRITADAIIQPEAWFRNGKISSYAFSAALFEWASCFFLQKSWWKFEL